MNGAKRLEKPMGMDEYEEAYKVFEEERIKRLKESEE